MIMIFMIYVGLVVWSNEHKQHKAFKSELKNTINACSTASYKMAQFMCARRQQQKKQNHLLVDKQEYKVYYIFLTKIGALINHQLLNDGFKTSDRFTWCFVTNEQEMCSLLWNFCRDTKKHTRPNYGTEWI